MFWIKNPKVSLGSVVGGFIMEEILSNKSSFASTSETVPKSVITSIVVGLVPVTDQTREDAKAVIPEHVGELEDKET